MRLGFRLQILLALGSLLVLAFLPLFFAVSSLTRASLVSVRDTGARSLGRAVAGHVLSARAVRDSEDLGPLLDAQIGRDGVAAIAVYDEGGRVVAMAGEVRGALPEHAHGVERAEPVWLAPGGEGLLVVVPDAEGAAAVIVETGASAFPSGALVRLFALYTGIVALALLVFAHLAMTRLVVAPVDRLSRAARRVADGARRFETPAGGARELRELGASLATMTDALVASERELQKRVAEVERTAVDLRKAQDRLVRSERLASVGRLAAGLAHEIGNPIAAILGFHELLEQGGLSAEEERDFLRRMRAETERIHTVLRGLLDFARPAVSMPPPAAAPPPGDVDRAVSEVLGLVRPQKAFKSVEIVSEVDPDLPGVALPSEALVQVLLNLVLNAADAAPKSGAVIVLRAKATPSGEVRVEVEDNGPGVAAEVRARLFEPFVTTKEVGKGTGLGLAVCRGLVEERGGTIFVEDGALGGARFVVEIPAAT